MLMLVTSDNFVQMFFGWEGVGLCSYLLIGFCTTGRRPTPRRSRPSWSTASADFGFALGIMGVFLLYDAVGFDTVFAATPRRSHVFRVPGYNVHALTTLCICCSSAPWVSRRRSACIPGCPMPWRADPGVGVSMRHHGDRRVFMVCRLSPMFEYAPNALATGDDRRRHDAIFAPRSV